VFLLKDLLKACHSLLALENIRKSLTLCLGAILNSKSKTEKHKNQGKKKKKIPRF
jgi:hypothetical protein